MVKVVALGPTIHRIQTPYAGGGTVFLYLLRGNDCVALVDTGVVDSPSIVLQPALAEMGLLLSDVDVVLNTHAHLDHSGGNLEMRRASGARIHLHAADLPMAESTDCQVGSHISPLIALDFPKEIVSQRANYVRSMSGDPAGVDVLLSDGDRIDLGSSLELRVIHSPGHTLGSVAYFWESEGILLTGDSVVGQGSRMGGYPLYFHASSYRRSLANLMKMDFRQLCLGHAYVGGTLINDPAREGEDGIAFLEESAHIADTLQRAVESAIGQGPEASKRQIALSALSELRYRLPQQLVRETDMPGSAGPTLASHIEAALSGSYPWGI